MAYTINYAGPSGANSFTIADGTLNVQSTPLNLPGRNYAGYGQPVDQGLVDTVQNFARVDANGPPQALLGQIWFKNFTPDNTLGGSANSLTALKVNYSNTSTPNWKSLVINDANSNVIFGNITVSQNLIAPTGSNVNLIGNWNVPATSSFNLATGGAANFIGSDVLTNYLSTTGPYTPGNIIGQWYVDPLSSITLGAGSTINASNGNLITTTLKAGGANTLANIQGNWYMDPGSKLNLNSSNLYIVPGSGTVVDLRTNAGTDFLYANNISAGSSSAVANLIGNYVINTGSNITLATNATANFVNGNLFSRTLNTGAAGTAGALTGAWTMTAGSSFNLATNDVPLSVKTVTTGGAGTVGSMTGTWGFTSGSSLNLAANSAVLYANRINSGATGTQGIITGQWILDSGSTLQASYADLGERFHADDVYEAGTVMELGGSAEITAVRDELSDLVFGVVSESAGYIMNGAAGKNDTHPIIAMTGRVPVKVKGSVKKFDRLVSAGNGYARAAKQNEITAKNVVGRALEDKLSDDAGQVLATVSVNI